MNYLELQQRANLLVDKVNQYEASLTETTLDETAILNQHLYADIYSLRPVLKMLFGKTIDDKLSRTLLNDVDLRVFASSSPMWNSSFNLLSAVKPSAKLSRVRGTSTYDSYYMGDANNYQCSYIREYPDYISERQKGYDLALPIRIVNTLKSFTLKLTTGTTENNQFIVSSPASGGAQYILIYNGKFAAYINGSLTTIFVNINVEEYTTYYLKFTDNNSDTCNLQISTDNINYSPAIQIDGFQGTFMCIGVSFSSSSSAANNCFRGSIDLGNSVFSTTTNLSNQSFIDVLTAQQFLILLKGISTYSYGYYFENQIQKNFTIFPANNFEVFIHPVDEEIIGNGSYMNLSFSQIGKSNSTSRNYNNYIQTSNQASTLPNMLVFTENRNSTGVTYYVYGDNYYDRLEISINDGVQIDWNIKLSNDGDNLRIDVNYIIPSTGASASKSFTRTNYSINNGCRLFSEGGSLGFGNLKSQYEIAGFSVDYQSNNRHEFMNDINMYNANNMIVQDAQINSILNRNSRIASGLNYSYSSNIQDALVTESQVANIFKWNTTTDKEIYNNTLTINRQVPGLVCYYLGNGYNGTYTATIPYAPRYDNINSVNYSTPVYYGAFYRNDDVEQSQVGLNMGAECCRIFMPGMNYTRGKLQSPQQIWQPDKRVGQDNIGYGFNWQGQAIYHELVFKNRRQGCQAKGLDFIPSISSDEDNDPQGLALRTALAQQKQFYYNRPFFDELTELNGVNITKLVEEIGNASRTEYTTHYTIVGNPTISDDFALTNTGNSNYVDTGYTASGFNSIEISFDVMFTDFNSTYYFTGQVDSHNYTCPQLASTVDGNLNLACSYNGSSWIYLYNTDVVLDLNTRYNLRVGWKNETKKWYGILTNVSTEVETNLGEVDCAQAPLFSYPLEICYDQGKPTYIQSGLIMYLDTFKITKDNNVDYQAVTSQVVPLDDEAFFRDYKLDYDTWATALDKPL